METARQRPEMAMNAPMQCIAVNRHTPPLNSLLPPLLGQLSARPALWSAAETRSESARNGQKRPKIAIRGYRGPFIVVRDCSTTSSEATISLPASGLQQKQFSPCALCLPCSPPLLSSALLSCLALLSSDLSAPRCLPSLRLSCPRSTPRGW